MTDISIKGITYPLNFDMDAWENIEAELGMMDNIREAFASKERIHAVRRVLYHLSGGKITDKVFNGVKPGRLGDMISAIWETFGDGMNMETKDDENEGQEVDEALEEIERKKGAQAD